MRKTQAKSFTSNAVVLLAAIVEFARLCHQTPIVPEADVLIEKLNWASPRSKAQRLPRWASTAGMVRNMMAMSREKLQRLA